MSNSKLICYTKLSPNRNSPRNHAIDTITIHHMAGNLSIETCGNIFANPSRQGSSNYGIGSDGRIALYVNESDRSWCSSNRANDNRAITIEVANDNIKTWTVSDKAYNSLINLVADICKRNGIKKLIWDSNKTNRINHKNGANMTVHRDFAATGCPGDYLFSKMPDIAKAVNAKLSNMTTTTKPTTTVKETDEVKYSELPVIKKSSKGDAVRVVQAVVKVTVDGVFGDKTATAVKKYQTSKKLTSDGIVGQNTWKKIIESL